MKTTIGQFTIECKRIKSETGDYSDAYVYNGQEQLCFQGSWQVKPRKFLKFVRMAIVFGLITETPLPPAKFTIRMKSPEGPLMANWLDRKSLFEFWKHKPYLHPPEQIQDVKVYGSLPSQRP